MMKMEKNEQEARLLGKALFSVFIRRKPNTEEKRSFFEGAWKERLRKIGVSYVGSNKITPF